MQSKEEMELFANEIRTELIRTFRRRGNGHIGGSLSIADLLAVLYSGTMRVDPEDPRWAERDLLVCSKGHAGPALYAALALKGFFPKEWLMTLNEGGTRLPSHCDRERTPGIDASTGSLGQGISQAAGMALGVKLDGSARTVYCIVGDGECQEGQVWEAAMFAAHYGLDSLILFVDWNKKQLDGTLAEIMDLGSLEEKFRVFGWDAVTVKGSDHMAVLDAIRRAKERTGRPSAIVLDTVKGAGIPAVEARRFCHHMALSPEFCDEMLAYLEEQAERLKEACVCSI
ncbi:transketolase [uncultured Oscillibacter sp.]|uniref:transketolase n=1 Tax=uncultured Oscillibacter sp. TaxID=876091 RepID=UPI0025E43B93|nr:transketolase [uncultured Oscillibacter sp.]